MLNNKGIELEITSPTGKVRVKRRSQFCEYGIPVATRKENIQQTDYIEWQIGYDLEMNKENTMKTSLSNYVFTNSRNKSKIPYELSEILFHSYRSGFVTDEEIFNTYNFVDQISPDSLIDRNPSLQICRTNPIQKTINDIKFFSMEVRYPLIVNKFRNYDIYTEVINREKQRAVGNQPMLYLCIPLTSSNLLFKSQKGPLGPIVGRTAQPKEIAIWKITKNEADLSILLFKIFGMLSDRHQDDIKSILKVLFPEIIP